MMRIEGDIVIRRPIEEVFDFVADERNEPLYNPNMRHVELLSTGGIGLGARFKAESVSIGRTVTMVIQITDYDRPNRLASTTSLPLMGINGELTFERVQSGTHMNWSWEIEPRGIFRLVTPLVSRIGRRQEERIWASLKRYLEEQAPPPSAWH